MGPALFSMAAEAAACAFFSAVADTAARMAVISGAGSERLSAWRMAATAVIGDVDAAATICEGDIVLIAADTAETAAEAPAPEAPYAPHRGA